MGQTEGLRRSPSLKAATIERKHLSFQDSQVFKRKRMKVEMPSGILRASSGQHNKERMALGDCWQSRRLMKVESALRYDLLW
jgi:hypothetical protein